MGEVKKQKEQKEEGLPIWMATFADMMTLLFAFFVLLFSMSTIDPVKVSAMEDAMNEQATKAGGGSNTQTGEAQLSINEIKESLQDIIDDLDLKDKATVSSDPRGVILEIDGSICFASLSMDLNNKFKEVLVQVKDKVMSHPYDKRTVIIEGHSDSEPIDVSAKYKKSSINLVDVWPTNRHLSAARASAVVEELTNSGFCLPDADVNPAILKFKSDGDCPKENSWYSMGIRPNRLVAAGYGEFWPYGVSWSDVKSDNFDYNDIIELNKTTEQRNKNRRVKIIFSKN